MDIVFEKGDFKIKRAEKEDALTIYELIRGIAEYEKMIDEVVNTPEMIKEWLFDKKTAETYIGEENGKPVGFILFFHNYSTFVGRAGIYVEDLFVIPEKRGKGYGKLLLAFAAHTAVERNCGRLEWTCLNWNKPSLDCYAGIGAVKMTEWTTHRLAGETLNSFAKCLK